MTVAECMTYMQQNAVDKEVNFKMANVLYGLLQLWHAIYGWFFLIAGSDQSFGAIYNMSIYLIMFIFWCGTFGRSKGYNTFFVYFSVAISPITSLMLMVF